MRCWMLMALAAAFPLFLAAGPAAGDCMISGSIAAELNLAQPELGAWKYTLTVAWDTGTPFALSHFNMLLGSGETCECADFAAALTWVDPTGSSDGDPDGCVVPYDTFLECRGDPSIGDDTIMLKFEPWESEQCEPGTTGQGSFDFYSDYPPAPIAEPNLFLVDKHGQLVCYGMLQGVFPGLPCDPTPGDEPSWGEVKSLFH